MSMNYDKKYKEALERAKYCLTTDMDNSGHWAVKHIFPELKESENKQSKEWILEYLRDGLQKSDDQYKDQFKTAINWLEHQDDKISVVSANFQEAEEEKREYLSSKFLKCRGDFLDFKEGQTYWLEYIGDDEYNVRSDNLLGKTYHITPGQLYSVFKPLNWVEKQDEKYYSKKVTMFYDYLNAHEQIFLHEKDEDSRDFIIRIKSMFEYIFNIK